MYIKKRYLAMLAGVFIAAIVFVTGCSNSTATPSNSGPATLAQSEQKMSAARNTPAVQVARIVGPTVVGITNKAVARDWFNNQIQYEQGVGSGVIFRKDGYIVTNNHVIAGAKELIVSLSDGRTLQGKLIGADELTDLAVVKIDANDLPTATFGNSDEIVVGEPAIAIGNPMGLEFRGSVTVGVISALNRTLEFDDRRLKLVQTDAAINPGNSGGALANADGQVIGISSAKISADAVEGMGFAIPINTVRDVINQLIEHGKVIRPYLGVGVFDKTTAARAGYRLNVDAGVYVETVGVRGPAYKAGIRRGDLILAIGGAKTDTVAELREALNNHAVGTTVKVRIERDGKKQTVDVTLEAMPSN